MVLRLGATRSLNIRVGAVVLVRDGSTGTYGAVVSSLAGLHVNLTFTPPRKPRRVPVGRIVSVSSGSDLVDPHRVPRIQPPATAVPRRRKGHKRDATFGS